MSETTTELNSQKPVKKKPFLETEPVHDSSRHQSWRHRLMTEIRLRKLTYDQLAEKMGVSQPQVAKHMQGKAKHYHAFVEDACKALDISTLWILEGIHPGDVSAPLYDEVLLRSWLLSESFIGERPPIREYYSCTRQFQPGKRTFAWKITQSDMDDGMGRIGSLPQGEVVFCDPDRPVHAVHQPVLLTLLDGGTLLRQLRRIGDHDYFVPLNRVYHAVPRDEVTVRASAVVIGGLRTVQLAL